MATITPIPDLAAFDKPQQQDLDTCVHCGLCLSACPTYRELGVEMDSPRGRIYQMVQVAEGTIEINDDYIEHIDLCLACRACETACPSGVQYGRLVEAARAQITANHKLPWPRRLARSFIFGQLLTTPWMLQAVGYLTFFYQRGGLQWLVRKSGVLKLFGSLAELERLTPYSISYLGDIRTGHKPARPWFRKTMASVLGEPEDMLFASDGDK